MLKIGIYKVQDIETKGSTLIRKEPKNVTITLYNKIVQEPNADELAERILLLFADERGAYKRTYTKRFEEFDSISLQHIEDIFKRDELLLVQDVGVSDGRTALDFFKKIASSFSNLKFTASDYNPKVYVLEKGKCKVTISSTGKLLEILYSPFVFNAIKRDSYKHYPLNHVIRLILHFLFVTRLIKNYKTQKIHATELMLFAPQALLASKNDPRFILTQYNLLESFKEQSNIIRAMNVLNPSYFSESEFRKVINHIHTSLCNGGLLITGSNQEAGTIVHGGIYKKTIKGFQKIVQSGEGSPIDHYLV